MTLNTNFNLSPYYDDYDESKKYLRLLFKPGYAVQARELTQIQSSLQNQIQKFGNHVFKNGSVITGGQFFLQKTSYLKLDNVYNNNDVDYANFVGKTITSTDLTKRGEVIIGFPATDTDPITLMVNQLYGLPFKSGETIFTKEPSPVAAKISTNGVGTGQIFSINEGVFYYDGFFISTDAQTVATSKYSSNTATVKIGFEIEESIINNNTDSSLLDPAQNASNYQAPGSDRYKINLILSTRSLDSEDDERFIELMQVRNGVAIFENRYPLYAVLGDELARRTYDESGNYTVRPFNISLETNSKNSAQTDIVLSPGKAYVYGYEFETNGPTTLTVDKPRTTSIVNNKSIPADYGNFVYTTNHFGAFPLRTLDTVNVYCVKYGKNTIDDSTPEQIANTKIGTVRVKSIAFESAANTSDSNTYVYRTSLFDINIGSITGNVVSIGETHVRIGSGFSNINNAYKGAKLRILTGTGSSESPKTVVSYTGANNTLIISPPFSSNTATFTSGTFSLDFEFNDAECFAKFISNDLTVYADIDNRSKDFATPYDDAIISDALYEPLIFDLGQSYIAPASITDMSYYFKKIYAEQSFSGGKTILALNGTEQIVSGSSTSQLLDNFYIAVTNKGSSIYSVGDIIPATAIDIENNELTVAGADNMVATIIATIYNPNPSMKPKTYIEAYSNIQTTGGTSLLGGDFISYPTRGQAKIYPDILNKIPGVSQSLYVSDVTEIVEIRDFKGLSISIGNLESSDDITSNYILDTGQRDSYYDHSSIILKPGVPTPVGPLLVRYNRFSTALGYGFFTVDSYSQIDYEKIPSYTSVNNVTFNLRDCIDFRPVRQDHTSFSTLETKLPVNGSNIILDYQYYLPRIDKVVLDKTKIFQIIQGSPSITPVAPEDTSTGMTLYILSYPPYVTDIEDIDVRQIDHRRYTMRDIGSIDKRVQNLEYYTALSLLEQETLSKLDLTILDSQNLPRFKNGIIVDSFIGHSIADVTNGDYKASIDRVKRELRPSLKISAHKLNFDSANSSNYTLSNNGYLLSLSANNVSFIQQPKASRAVNVNPFNVLNFLGKIGLYPPSDIWIDTQTRPAVLVNLGGNNDAWAQISAQPINVEWGSWNTIWTGIDGNRLLQTQTRTGIQTFIVPQTITQSLGSRVVDVSVIPFMRENNIIFVGTSFKPSTTVYPFFDNKAVNNNVGNRVNKFKVNANNVQYKVDYTNPEIVTIRSNSNNAILGTGTVVKTSNNIVYVTNVTATTGFSNCKIVGSRTSLEYTVVEYEHNGGTVKGSTANTITLDIHAANANNIDTFVGSTIRICQGLGVGQSRTITAYNPTTRVATLSSNWSIQPYSTSTPSFYGIGNLRTDNSGNVVGIFTIPGGTFKVGEKLFRLIDSSDGDLSTSSTSGDVSFFAQGTLRTLQETIISTIQPTIQRRTVQETQTTTTWIDPVAQSFLVDPQQYPEGVFISKIRFCFKTKDDAIPITLQIRPTVNGYPSSTVIYPYSTVTLTPDKIKISETPNITDANKYTDFVFEAPVYLQPGEHSFVLISNSNRYEVYLAQIGKTDIVTNTLISEQPYGGSYFASQNSSTWTADQSLDLMFEIFRLNFTNTSGTAQFNITPPELATPYSVVQLLTSDIIIAKTALNYTFRSEKLSTGYSSYIPITPNEDYELIDASGLKVISNTSGSSTFILKGSLSSSSSIVSPIIDVSRPGIIVVENIINNLGLSNTGFVIENSGSNYANSSSVTINISGGGGSGATAKANVVDGKIVQVYVTNPGSNYYTTPTISVSSPSGSNALIKYVGETSPRGGNALAKYICRKVVLAEGFNSGDLRVYITAYKPFGTNIYVYYKILSESDPEQFEKKSWQLMTQLGNANFSSINQDDYRELSFAPGVNGVANNSVSYVSNNSSYSTFKTFAIKIVFSSSNPTIVPKVRDFRAIALPAG